MHLYSALQGVEPNWLVSCVWLEPQFGQITSSLGLAWRLTPRASH